MSRQDVTLTGRERTFPNDEIIVSKTDPQGRITYANDIFLDVSGYSEEEILGQPHSIIRHPAMPRCVFKLLWDTISAGDEIFAYVNNRAKCGDNYWVLAHVTPNRDVKTGTIVGYHSSRRAPKKTALDVIAPIYQKLLQEEQRHADRKVGMQAGFQMLLDMIKASGFENYHQFVFSVINA